MIYHKKEDISRYNTDEMQIWRRKLGIVFQDYKLIEHMSVKDNIMYPLILYGLGENVVESKYNKLKQKYNISSIEESPVKLLSTGEKQKVAIARALIHEPEFLIADEPTGNLDWEHTEVIANLLMQANQSGNTILVITHDIHLVNYLKEKHKIRLEIMN